MNSTEEGHICRPPQGAVGLFFYYFFAVFPDGSQVGCFQAADGRLARAEKCGWWEKQQRGLREKPKKKELKEKRKEERGGEIARREKQRKLRDFRGCKREDIRGENEKGKRIWGSTRPDFSGFRYDSNLFCFSLVLNCFPLFFLVICGSLWHLETTCAFLLLVLGYPECRLVIVFDFWNPSRRHLWNEARPNSFLLHIYMHALLSSPLSCLNGGYEQKL